MNNIIFFDTETTGLPKSWKGGMKEVSNWPRVIQLAWEVCDIEGDVIHQRQFLIKPDGWEIPSIDMYLKQGKTIEVAKKMASFWIDNGFTQAKNQAEGVQLFKVLLQFIEDLKTCNLMVAHNMKFDYPVLGAEFIRYMLTTGRKLERICTMESSVQFCDLHRKKWPRLEELHRMLFGCDFEGAHDALNDVIACRKCFFALKEKGIIKLP